MISPTLFRICLKNQKKIQIDQFAEHLSEKLTCDEIFPRLEGGFSDGEPAIREKTVIAVVHLAPKYAFCIFRKCGTGSVLISNLNFSDSGASSSTTTWCSGTSLAC